MTVHEVCDTLKSQDQILILCHQSPDGDTLGAGFGLHYALKKLGKTTRVACSDPVPKHFLFLQDENMPDFTPGYVVAVDIADTQLLGKNLAQWADKVDLCIDHHPSNQFYARQTLLKADAAAAVELVYEIVKGLDVAIDKQIAECIYTGLCTDTGCFQFSNVTAYTLRIAADMIDYGADHANINRIMFDTKSRARIAMEQEALASLTYALDGKIAVIALTSEMMNRTGVAESELEGISSIPRQIEGVEVGITLRQKEDGFKVSMRTVRQIDASKVCAVFSGGGHARAAGCFIPGDLDSCREKIVAAAAAAFAGEPGQ